MPKIEKEYEHTRPFLTVAYNPLRLLVRQATTKGYIECYRGGVFDGSYVISKVRRGRVQRDGKISPTLTATAIESIYIFEGIDYDDNNNCNTDIPPTPVM